MTIDLEELAAVIRLLKDAEFSEFNYTKGDVALQIRRGDQVASNAPMAMSAAAPVAKPVAAPIVTAAQPAVVAPAEETAGAKIRAPLLGTFYSTPKPGEPAFVKIGDRVEPDTVVCIIEVMKLMNSVAAGITGTVAAIHVRDGDLVEHDQPLFTVVPE